MVIEPQPLQQIRRTFVRWHGRTLSYFSGCEYFRLSSHPKVNRAVIDGLSRFGLNVAASRLTTGNHRLYGELERRLQSFFKAEAALLVSTGYVTNLAVAQALSGQFSHALIDRVAHTSLRDAARLLECPVLDFAHRSVPNLVDTVRRCGPAAKLILLTDGCFARDGSVAPLAEYQKCLPKDALLLVDDAHAAGVLGAHGRGSLEFSGARRTGLIQTITLSKAFGIYGGAILSSKAVRQRILERSHLFVGSTPIPLPLVNAALVAVDLLANSTLRARLAENTAFVTESLRLAGIMLPERPAPIVALQATNGRNGSRLKQLLLEHGIFPPLVRYPGGPPEGYFRFVISSEHSRAQLRTLVQALTAASKWISPLTTG